MCVVSPDAIVEFLLRCKNYISQGRFEFVPRSKSMRALTALGWSVEDVERVILELEPSNYAKGPEPDRDTNRPGDVYIFGVYENGTELYIKLKCDDQRGCVCFSFHEAQRPLTYPFREG